MGFFNKLFGKKEEEKEQLKEDLNQGLEKSRKGFFSKVATTFAGRTTIDEDVLDDLEDILIASDVGVETTIKIIKRIEDRVAKDKYVTTKELNEILRDEIVQLLALNNSSDAVTYEAPEGIKPYVIMVIGVNGVGKTTTIGKLANKYKEAGKKVLLGAGDTFRAAAVDQLEIWADRVGCDFYSKGMNVDPAAVAYETVRHAKENGHDVVFIDTAGRLHNKVGLMRELEKINKSIGKQIPGAPHEVMLVLDGSTGQNAYEQAKHFASVTNDGITALTVTKLDGTAKGGVVIGISDQFNIPIKYIGVGEGIQHLQEFDKREFVNSFFKTN
jgi:fused signal recognition particle receptor